MKARLWLFSLLIMISGTVAAQQRCDASSYLQRQIAADPALRLKLDAIEQFTKTRTSADYTSRNEQHTIIRIPVVVHILYHSTAENITDEQVQRQLDILNKCFRRQNPDTVNTPEYFRSSGADCGFEFKLATSDPKKRSTTGIIRKYTPVTLWQEDDQMKYSAQTGDDAWDSKSYLNIWVCNLDRVMGYATMPGGPADKDGVVIGSNVFGGNNADFTSGKTVVHETGHWLNLKHIWGDTYCGDDGVDDTPKQSGYNVGCPSGIRKTCGNTTYGDMYMNYMDFTGDACMNLFTQGQSSRMRSLFEPGGARNSMLSSTGLDVPLIFESPLPADDPRWLHPQLYPNPANSVLTLDLAYDVRWVGHSVQISNAQGQVVMSVQISNRRQTINISALQPGIYFIMGKKDDGATIKEKFVRM